MALAPLATTADLTARGIDITDASRATALLASASSAVRDAAGVPISKVTSTIELDGGRGQWLALPVSPVRTVSSVKVDDVEVSDYRLRSGALWRACGWLTDCGPSSIEVTVAHGLDDVPADIVDLVCSLVAAGMAAAGEGYDPKRSLAYESIDDYRYGMRQGDDEIVSPMILPDRTREWLRVRFGGGGVAVTGVRE